MIMKHIVTKLFLLLLLATAGTAKAQQWETIQTGVDEDLYDICCIDANTFFACGQNGVILKSEDGGRTWYEKHRHSEWSIFSLKFADENVGYGFLHKERNPFCLLKTIDAGETWFLMEPFAIPDKSLIEHRDGPYYLYQEGKPMELFVLNADTLFIRNYDWIYRSIDGGLTFTEVGDLGFMYFYGEGKTGIKGEYFEGESGWLVGYDKEDPNTLRVMKTEDCGEHWDNIANYPFSNLYIAAVYPDKEGCAKIYGSFSNYNGTGASYHVIETNDGFEHVTMSLVNGDLTDLWFAGIYSDVDFCSSSFGCFFNSWEIGVDLDKDPTYVYNDVFITDDGGTSWSDLSPGHYNEGFLYDVVAIDSMFLIASQHGRLYRYGNNTQTVDENHMEVILYSNSSNNAVTVKAPTENAVIRFYDLQGRLLLAKPFDFNTTISTSQWTPGIYLWELWNGTRKEASGKWVKE